MSDFDSYLKLSFPLLQFKEGSSIKYDSTNKDFIQVSEDTVTVTPSQGEEFQFQFKISEPLISSKLSFKRNYLCGLTNSCFVFVELKNLIQFELKLNTKTKVLGYLWVSSDTILIINTTSIDIYKLKNSTVTLLKSFSQTVFHYLHSPESTTLLIFPEKSAYGIPFKYTDSSLKKLNKITFNSYIDGTEFYLNSIYSQCFLIHINKSKQEILIYKLKNDDFILENTLHIFTIGHLSINIVDSLLIIHNNSYKLSMVYDVALKYEHPLSYPVSISPYKKYSIQDELKSKEPDTVDLYSNHWEFLYPNLIVDKKLGFVFELQLHINEFSFKLKKFTNDESDLEHMKFLFRRMSGRSKLIDLIYQFCLEKPLNFMAQAFQWISKCYLQWIIQKNNSRIETEDGDWSVIGDKKEKVWRSPNIINDYIPNQNTVQYEIIDKNLNDDEGYIIQSQVSFTVVDQQEMYKTIFSGFESSKKLSNTRLFNLVIEYIRALQIHKIPVAEYIQRFAITLLIKAEQYSMLHQYLQYKVFGDSKSIAFQILAIEDKYKPALQIALDMLTRLGDYSTICEILLSRRKISHALAVMHQNELKIPYKLIFESVIQQNDDLLFYNSFEILKKMNLNLKKSSEFTKLDDIEEYIQLYNEKFNPTILK